MAGEHQPQHVPADEPAPVGDLPDEAVVVRGGLLDYGTFRAALMAYESKEPHVYAAINPAPYAASFHCWPGHTAAETVAYVRGLGLNLLKHDYQRTTTVGQLRAAGYVLLMTNWQRRHCSLFLSAIPTEFEFETLRALFGPPIHNPLGEP